jgi:hypothetical protein
MGLFFSRTNFKSLRTVRWKNYPRHGIHGSKLISAIDEAGNLLDAVPRSKKEFIKFNKMGIKITEKGAEYSITATPEPMLHLDASR